MPASQIDDQIIIQQSALDQTFTVAAKSYHPKGAFIADIVGLDVMHEFKRAWLGTNINCMDGSMKVAAFEMLNVIAYPKVLHIRAASSNYYLLYIDLKNEPVLYPIFSKTEVQEWLNAKQLWHESPLTAFSTTMPNQMMASTSMSALLEALTGNPVLGLQVAAQSQKPKKLPPAKLPIEPPAGKRRIKLG